MPTGCDLINRDRLSESGSATLEQPIKCQCFTLIILLKLLKNKGCCRFRVFQAIKDYLPATLPANKRLKAGEEAFKAQCRGTLIVDVAGIRVLGKMVNQVSGEDALSNGHELP